MKNLLKTSASLTFLLFLTVPFNRAQALTIAGCDIMEAVKTGVQRVFTAPKPPKSSPARIQLSAIYDEMEGGEAQLEKLRHRLAQDTRNRQMATTMTNELRGAIIDKFGQGALQNPFVEGAPTELMRLGARRLLWLEGEAQATVQLLRTERRLLQTLFEQHLIHVDLVTLVGQHPEFKLDADVLAAELGVHRFDVLSAEARIESIERRLLEYEAEVAGYDQQITDVRKKNPSFIKGLNREERLVRSALADLHIVPGQKGETFQ